MKTKLAILVCLAMVCVSSTAMGVSAENLMARAGVSGGVIVQVGCGQGDMLAELAAGNGRLVQGLDTNPANVKAARRNMLDRNLLGKVSVALFDGHNLPYVDNMVNLVIVDQSVSTVERSEIMRVLVPNGVALIGNKKIVKPVPSDIDEWSHFEHGPENNPVANDTVIGPPRHLQWTAGPRWLRSHEIPSGITSLVTAGGRVFYTLDEGPIGITDARLPEKWCVIARDAFNGTLLWKIPLPHWGWQTWSPSFREKFKDAKWILSHGLRGSNPDSFLTRMVADSDRLYFTLGYSGPVSIIDAATGKTLAVCKGSDSPTKLLLCNGILCVQTKDSVLGYNPRTGEQLWKIGPVDVSEIAAHGNSVVYRDGKKLYSADIKTGRPLWTADLHVKGKLRIASGKVLVDADRDLETFSLDTGTPIWCNLESCGQNLGRLPKGDYRYGCFIVDNTIWLGYRGTRVDLNTGKPLPPLDITNLWSTQHHHRCYPDKATTRYIIGGKEGMEFLAIKDDISSRNNWVRGACSLGIVPANGMTYSLPDQCFCSPGVKVLGFNALTAAKTMPQPVPVSQRLLKGPYYGQPAKSVGNAEWPAFRHDSKRTGSTDTKVSTDLKRAWQTYVGPTITQPAVSDGRLFVASKDTHTVYALDSRSGKSLWRFTTGGRVDSTPTLWKGYVLFGSADGNVYCLRQTDGGLVWKFQAAPYNRQIQSYGQLESVWPLNGSVLMLDGLAYISAGRSTYLDGGLYLYALDPATGRVVYHHEEVGPYEDYTKGSGHSFWSEGSRNDVLVTDGTSIFIMQLRFNKRLEPNPAPTESLLGDRKEGLHMCSTAGFLDDSWYDRTFWVYSNMWPGYYLTNEASKSGQLLVVDDKTTYGVKVFWTRNRHSPMFFPATIGYILFADDNSNEPMLVGRDKGTPITWLQPINMTKKGTPKKNWGPQLTGAPWESDVNAYSYNKDKGVGYVRAKTAKWMINIPVRIRAMVKTKDNLFIAGPPDIMDKQDPLGALEGRKGGSLRSISASTGLPRNEYKLEYPPVFDGLVAAEGKLFMATIDGKLSCWQ